MPFDGKLPPKPRRYIVTPAGPARYRPGASLSLADDPIAATRLAIKLARDQQRPVEVWTGGENDRPVDLLALVHVSGRVDVSRNGADHCIPAGMALMEEIEAAVCATTKPGAWQQRKSAARSLGATCVVGALLWALGGGVVVLLVRAVEAAIQ